MFSAAALLIASVMLFYVLKYRVHVHVTYTPRPSGKHRRRIATAVHDIQEPTQERPVSRRSVSRESLNPSAAVATTDIVSALRNLGCSPGVAKQAAHKATQEAQDFDTALKLAIRYATEGKAA